MSPHKKWFVIHTYSGCEEQVREALRQRIAELRMQAEFGEILIPAETAGDQRDGAHRRPRKKPRVGAGPSHGSPSRAARRHTCGAIAW